jgi:hypothetical protein
MHPPDKDSASDSRSGPVAGEVYDLATAAELSGMHPGMILELGQARVVTVIQGDDSATPLFDTRAIYRLRQIEVLREERALSMRSVRFVVELIDRLEAAERELRSLRERSP